MTLKEFAEKTFCYSKSHAEIIVIQNELIEEDINKEIILFTIKSSIFTSVYLKEEYLNARVTEIYAYKQDKFIVAISTKEEK